MRPYLADWLNRTFGTTVFTYLFPNYLMLLATGVFVGTVYAARRARTRGLNAEIHYGLILWALPAALLGGRIMGFLYAPETYGGNFLNIFDPLRGDSAAYGGFIGGVVAGVGYMLYRRVPVWSYLDCVGPPLAVAAAFTRVGCFLDGCDFGAVTSCAWAVVFPAGSNAHRAHLDSGWISATSSSSLPVHPVQLYLVAGDLALAAVAAWRSCRPGRTAGVAFLEFWILYGVMRFGIEHFRGDAMRGFIGALSTSQAVSVVVVGLAATLIVVRRAWWTLFEVILAISVAAGIFKLAMVRGGWAEALAPAVWIYVPLGALLWRRLPLAEHGFSLAAWSRGAKVLLAALAGVLVPFVALVLAGRWLVGSPPGLNWAAYSAWAAFLQLTLVAVPEEVFFRGYVHERLRSWALARPGASQRSVAWLVIILGAVLFAAVHVAAEPGWMRAGVFFPSLVLGWLRERTGGLLAPAGFHWCANLSAMGLELAG
jgi:phosphatidylglycerol:prolipoprotein diacylglycerol transferase